MFFFQAEGDIRDSPVTGVQTCARTISRSSRLAELHVNENTDATLLQHHKLTGSQLLTHTATRSSRLAELHVNENTDATLLQHHKLTGAQ